VFNAIDDQLGPAKGTHRTGGHSSVFSGNAVSGEQRLHKPGPSSAGWWALCRYQTVARYIELTDVLKKKSIELTNALQANGNNMACFVSRLLFSL
jgi:hypothetical protein